VTREPVNTDGHYSRWLWRWVCDRIACRTKDTAVSTRDALPSPKVKADRLQSAVRAVTEPGRKAPSPEVTRA